MELIIKDPRRTFLVFLLASIGMIAVALFMEHFLELKPCILCYMQRGGCNSNWDPGCYRILDKSPQVIEL